MPRILGYAPSSIRHCFRVSGGPGLFGFRATAHPDPGNGAGGVVDAVGSGVTRFQVGEPVLGRGTTRQGRSRRVSLLSSRVRAPLLVRKPESSSVHAGCAALARTEASRPRVIRRRMGRLRPGGKKS